jgi:threonine dehydrogenase-like Zn-dependent dehydrogenase
LKAVVFAGEGKVRVDDVAKPSIQDPGDALVEVRRAAICASDLHLLDGKTPGMREGATIGHEYVGILRELGDDVAKHDEDTRVLGSFLIVCGECAHCEARRFNFCSNRRALGLGPLTGDLEGAQAEFVRVPNADLNLKQLKGALSGLSDEEALFAGDILTTGFYAAALGDAGEGETVVIIGAGPVGLFCATAAARKGARVIVLDQDKGRVKFAKDMMGLDAIDVSKSEAQSEVNAATEGKLADVVVDAVGAVEVVKTALKCVRDGGVIAVVGVYGQERYELPMGVAWVRGVDIRFSGMANIHAHWDDALMAVAKGEIDPTKVITHRMPLDDAEKGYELFKSRKAMKVVFEL